MPIAHFHLVDGAYSADQTRRLLVEASTCYSEVLDSPIERVRAFVVRYSASDVAVSGLFAPYFTAIVLAGRPVAQRQELAARFTDLVVDILGAPRSAVRGQIIEVDPVNWFIAGEAAAGVRAGEIASRASG